MCLPFLQSVMLVFCCAVIDIATCQVLLIFKMKVQVEKCGNLWNFLDSPTISDALVYLSFIAFFFVS